MTTPRPNLSGTHLVSASQEFFRALEAGQSRTNLTEVELLDSLLHACRAFGPGGFGDYICVRIPDHLTKAVQQAIHEKRAESLDDAVEQALRLWLKEP